MVTLAIGDNQRFQASRIEIDRPGPSYAVDTISRLYKLHGVDTELFWIIGADMLVDFHVWKDSNRILDMCRFIATTRPGYDRGDAPPDVVDRVQLTQISDIGISSTEIRERLREGRSVRYLVPEPVFAYIHEHQLYSRPVGN